MYEPETTAAVLDLVAARDVVLDVGANVGYYSCLAVGRGAYVPVRLQLTGRYLPLDGADDALHLATDLLALWRIAVPDWEICIVRDVGTTCLPGPRVMLICLPANAPYHAPSAGRPAFTTGTSNTEYPA